MREHSEELTQTGLAATWASLLALAQGLPRLPPNQACTRTNPQHLFLASRLGMLLKVPIGLETGERLAEESATMQGTGRSYSQSSRIGR